jgi:hypothetical protein
MILPGVIFVLFTVLATLGAYLITAHHRGWRAGLAVAAASLLFFAALAIGLVVLLRSGGAL